MGMADAFGKAFQAIQSHRYKPLKIGTTSAKKKKLATTTNATIGTEPTDTDVAKQARATLSGTNVRIIEFLGGSGGKK